MRLLASLEHYAVASGEREVVVHQYLPGTFTVDVAGGEAVLRLSTDYPWEGPVTLTVESAPEGEWTLTLRVPGWADGASLSVGGQKVDSAPSEGWWRVTRTWAAGDEVVLDLPLAPRLTQGDPRMDAIRGCVAIERGPLVYCLEGLDQKVSLDEVVVAPEASLREGRDDGLGIVTVEVDGAARPRPEQGWWPYAAAGSSSENTGDATPLVAVPYFAWGNRGRSTMRVWIPTV